MEVSFPYAITGSGRTDGRGDHLRALIEQVLFTSPGERVNRPDFGAGLQELVFAPESVEVVGATRLLVQGALEQWLGDRIEVDEVRVEPRGSRLEIHIRFIERSTGRRDLARYDLEVP